MLNSLILVVSAISQTEIWMYEFALKMPNAKPMHPRIEQKSINEEFFRYFFSSLQHYLCCRLYDWNVMFGHPRHLFNMNGIFLLNTMPLGAAEIRRTISGLMFI